MSHKKKISFSLVVSVVVFAIGLVFLFAENLGLCSLGLCSYQNQFAIGKSLVEGALFVIPLFVLLYLFSDSIFKTWGKFGYPYILLSILLIALSPTDCGGAFFSICLTKEILVELLGAIFLLISLAIIIYKKVKEGKK